jgi:hypothetical protein
MSIAMVSQHLRHSEGVTTRQVYPQPHDKELRDS